MSRPEPPRLAVVLAVRDGERYLPTQLAALRGEDPPFTWELIAVDDGSVDQTRLLLERSASDGLPVTIVPGPGRGTGAARHAGVARATGELLVFLDHDDEVEPGYLAAMAAALEDHELVAARLDCSTLNPGWVGRYRPPSQTDVLADDFRPFAACCSLGIRWSAYEQLGGFDRSLHGPEDRDLCYRAALAGMELTLADGAVLRYRYRADLRDVFRQAVRGGRGTVELFRRHRDRGMPRRLLKAEVRRWLDVLADVARRRATVDRARQLHELGQLVGHVEGCVRSRVWWFRWR